MNALRGILGYYGMPEENIDLAIEQIAETYGASRYLEGVSDGAEAVNDLASDMEADTGKELRNEPRFSAL